MENTLKPNKKKTKIYKIWRQIERGEKRRLSMNIMYIENEFFEIERKILETFGNDNKIIICAQ